MSSHVESHVSQHCNETPKHSFDKFQNMSVCSTVLETDTYQLANAS